MPVKVQFSARSLTDLRLYLRAADFDFGCRPVARRDGSVYVVEAAAEADDVARLTTTRTMASVEVRIVEDLGPRSAFAAAPVGAGDRFAEGVTVRGLGRKEAP